MPLKVQVIHERRLICVDAPGVVTDDDLLEYVHAYLGQGELRLYDELFDLTRSDLEDVTWGGLAAVAAAAAATDPDSEPTHIALLVSEASGMVILRMYETLRERQGGRRAVRLFYDRAKCLGWLRLPPDWVPDAG